MTILFNREDKSRQIGRNIALLRQKSGLTQEQVAEILDIGNEAVSRIERGVIIPNALRLFELAQIFNCSVSDFFGENKIEEHRKSNRIDEILQTLPETDRLLILDVLDKLATRLNKP